MFDVPALYIFRNLTGMCVDNSGKCTYIPFTRVKNSPHHPQGFAMPQRPPAAGTHPCATGKAVCPNRVGRRKHLCPECQRAVERFRQIMADLDSPAPRPAGEAGRTCTYHPPGGGS